VVKQNFKLHSIGIMIVKLRINMKVCRSIVFLILVMVMATPIQMLYAQEPPPRPIEVTVTAQTLNFGAFSHGSSGGTVTVTPETVRSASGDIILLSLGFSFTPALYRLVGDPGTVVSILNGPDATLTRTGGGTLTLEIGDSDPSGSFIISTTPPAYTELRVGGILTVSNSTNNPPGSYSGFFDITLVQE
jgi:hypothetical protein